MGTADAVGQPRSGTQLGDMHPGDYVGQPLGGNTFILNNRPFRLGHGNYQPAYTRHPQYQGYWNGNYGGYPGGFGSGVGYGMETGLGLPIGYGGYGYRPLGWGLGAWGLGAVTYNSGYLPYYNPYYIDSFGAFGSYSYSQPNPVVYYTSPEESVSSNILACDQSLRAATEAFKQNNYNVALNLVNKGLVQCPDDAVMHEFRGLVLFAKNDYHQAAATLHSVLAVGPGWNWTTLSSLYSSVRVYTEQIRELEAYVHGNPQNAASRFLLAYHYMVDGFPDAAARQLEIVVRLEQNDLVAADLLRMVSKWPAPQPAQPPTPEAPTASAVKPFDPAMLVGTWRATRADGSRFEMTLKNDASFHWKFTLKETVQEFGGAYTYVGNVLGLERKDGGSLIAGVVPTGAQQFNFKLLGAPPEDPGLVFSK